MMTGTLNNVGSDADGLTLLLAIPGNYLTGPATHANIIQSEPLLHNGKMSMFLASEHDGIHKVLLTVVAALVDVRAICLGI